MSEQLHHWVRMTASPPQLRVTPQSRTGRHRRDWGIAPARLGQLAVISGVSGALSAIPVSPLLQSILLLIFSVAGVGSAAVCWLALPRGAAVAGVLGLSVAGVMAFTTALVWLRLWYPVPACLLLSCTVAAVGLLRLWTLRQAIDAEPIALPGTRPANDVDSGVVPIRQPRRATNSGSFIATAVLLFALILWALSLPMLRDKSADQWGLLATRGGVLLLAAVLVAVTGFVVAIAAHRTVIAAVAIVVVIIVERVTVPLITQIPIYTWTYKHIGVVDYIVRYKSLAPSSVDIYTEWPAFFTAMAWFSSVTNLDLVTAAHWFAPLSDALVAVLVATFALSFGSTMRTALTAAMLAQLLNWVGQDYYSPQSIAVVLATATVTLLSYSKSVPTAGYVSVPIFCVLVATHQLTPVWVCGVAVALALLRLISPRWLGAAYVVILALYLLPRSAQIERYGWFSGFNPFANSKPVINNRGSDGRVFSLLVERGLSAAMWVAAAICFIVLWRRASGHWLAAIVAFSPMMVLLGANYGGEAIFRVFLYSLLGCAVLIAPFLTSGLALERAGRRLLHVIVSWVAMLLVAAAGMQGYYGSWVYLTITRNQLEQSRWLLATNVSGTTITVMAPPAGWPERASADYVRHALVSPWYDNPLDDLRNSLLKGLPTPEAIDNLEADTRKTALYIVLPRQVWAYNSYMGLFPPGALESLVEQLSQRPNWVKIIDDYDTLVYLYTPPGL